MGGSRQLVSIPSQGQVEERQDGADAVAISIELFPALPDDVAFIPVLLGHPAVVF